MNISLRRRERIFINGAVIRVDRKVNLELLNDVTFLLENHVMQPEDATTPLKQLYFAIQTMLISPHDCIAAQTMAHTLIGDILQQGHRDTIHQTLVGVLEELERKRIFDALKNVRTLIRETSGSNSAELLACPKSQMEAGL
jgi:flagellar protein FlbT